MERGHQGHQERKIQRLRGGFRFPFDGANRIRFEGLRGGSCPSLSPTPRVRLNKCAVNRRGPRASFNLISRSRDEQSQQVEQSVILNPWHASHPLFHKKSFHV